VLDQIEKFLSKDKSEKAISKPRTSLKSISTKLLPEFKVLLHLNGFTQDLETIQNDTMIPNCMKLKKDLQSKRERNQRRRKCKRSKKKRKYGDLRVDSLIMNP